MRARVAERRANAVAELKLRIIRQQEIAAKYARNGKAAKALAARAKLLTMLNQLDLLEHCSSEARPD
jgi:hypothetical protein